MEKERMMILEMLESGKITPADAQTLLRALGDDEPENAAAPAEEDLESAGIAWEDQEHPVDPRVKGPWIDVSSPAPAPRPAPPPPDWGAVMSTVPPRRWAPRPPAGPGRHARVDHGR